MADETDDKPKSDTPAVTPRRRAPRKTTTTRAAATKAPAKPRGPRAKPAEPSAVEKVETAVSDAAKTTRRARAAVTKAEGAVSAAAKTVKPRSTKRATPRAATKKPAAKKRDSDGTSKWGIAAIGAGVATVGAVAAAALLSLRGSTPKDGKKAHGPTGEDASKSFEAGIADENTIPDKG